VIKTRGAEDIARCPFRIAIVSTGLIFHDSEERRHLLERRFGTVILDEAHKARRRGGLGEKKHEPNNLLEFMLAIGPRTKNLLLGTATPIQTEVHELWDLLRILNAGADFVLGRECSAAGAIGKWPCRWSRATRRPPTSGRPGSGCAIRLPPGSEDALFASLRLQLGLPERAFFTDRGFGSLGFFEQQAVGQTLAPGSFKSTTRWSGTPSCGGGRRWRRQGCWSGRAWNSSRPGRAPTAYPGVGFAGSAC
jgi:hypothetical protein